MQKNIKKLMELANRKSFDRYPLFQSELINLWMKTNRLFFKVRLNPSEVALLSNLYFKIKEENIHYLVIRILYQSRCTALKEFYLEVYNFETKLSMRFSAIRGYLLYANEEEATELLKRFEEKIKRASLDYREYEPLVSVYGFPYLLKKYKYESLKNIYKIVIDNYNQIPKPLRGIFTLNKNGEVVSLVTKEEASARIKKVIEANERSKNE